jgi:hypothetical protein
MRTRSILVSALIVATPAVAVAQDHQHTADELGSVTFPVTCTAPAQQQMSRGVAMLHSFWFTEARKTFEGVVAADPACGVAHWGIALSHFGNPMGSGSGAAGQAAGWAAAQKGMAAGAKSDRDRAYIDAAAALFRDHDKTDNRTRMRAYEAALKTIVDKNPRDTEAEIFHSLFMVANADPADLTFAQQKKAAETLTRLYREQPKHPGLAHYIIHAFDSPPLAQLALSAARQYAGIAPAAPHALHMPSHIFTRLGYWDESIKTNRRSADLEPGAGGKSHPLDYMVYAFLQQGRDAQALKTLEELGGSPSGKYSGSGLTSYNALAIPARYALERDDWKAAAALEVSKTGPSAEAVTHFAKGLGAARSGDVALAKQEVTALEKAVADLTAARDSYWAHVVDAQRLAVAAWVAHAEGRHPDALRLAQQAADKEDQVEKAAVTPGPLIPARELLGDILMVHNDAAGALKAYETTLIREPNRARTLTGAARAATKSGNAQAAQKHYRALVDLLDPGSTRPELAEAKRAVGR